MPSPSSEYPPPCPTELCRAYDSIDGYFDRAHGPAVYYGSEKGGRRNSGSTKDGRSSDRTRGSSPEPAVGGWRGGDGWGLSDEVRGSSRSGERRGSKNTKTKISAVINNSCSSSGKCSKGSKSRTNIEGSALQCAMGTTVNNNRALTRPTPVSTDGGGKSTDSESPYALMADDPTRSRSPRYRESLEHLKEYIYAYFDIRARNSSIQNELRAGLTLYATMSYILVINPHILKYAYIGTGTDVIPFLTTSTAIVATVGTALMGLYANLPLGVAPGMGLNAYFAFELVMGGRMAVAEVLGCGIVSSLIILVLSYLGLFSRIVASIPVCLKKAVVVGIGLYQAIIGLAALGIIRSSNTPAVLHLNPWAVGSTEGGTQTDSIVGGMGSPISTSIAVFTLLLIALLILFNTAAPILLGMIISTGVSMYLQQVQLPPRIFTMGGEGGGGGCAGGIFSCTQQYLERNIDVKTAVTTSSGWLAILFIVLIILVDTGGVMMGIALQSEELTKAFREKRDNKIKNAKTGPNSRGGYLGVRLEAVTISGNPLDLNEGRYKSGEPSPTTSEQQHGKLQPDPPEDVGSYTNTVPPPTVLADSGSTEMVDSDKGYKAIGWTNLVAALAYNSPVIIFLESSAAVNQGGRTGIPSVVTAVLFALSIIATNLLTIVASTATVPVMILVGSFMMSAVYGIDWYGTSTITETDQGASGGAFEGSMAGAVKSAAEVTSQIAPDRASIRESLKAGCTASTVPVTVEPPTFSNEEDHSRLKQHSNKQDVITWNESTDTNIRDAELSSNDGLYNINTQSPSLTNTYNQVVILPPPNIDCLPNPMPGRPSQNFVISSVDYLCGYITIAVIVYSYSITHGVLAGLFFYTALNGPTYLTMRYFGERSWIVRRLKSVGMRRQVVAARLNTLEMAISTTKTRVTRNDGTVTTAVFGSRLSDLFENDALRNRLRENNGAFERKFSGLGSSDSRPCRTEVSDMYSDTRPSGSALWSGGISYSGNNSRRLSIDLLFEHYFGRCPSPREPRQDILLLSTSQRSRVCTPAVSGTATPVGEATPVGAASPRAVSSSSGPTIGPIIGISNSPFYRPIHNILDSGGAPYLSTGTALSKPAPAKGRALLRSQSTTGFEADYLTTGGSSDNQNLSNYGSGNRSVVLLANASSPLLFPSTPTHNPYPPALTCSLPSRVPFLRTVSGSSGRAQD